MSKREIILGITTISILVTMAILSFLNESKEIKIPIPETQGTKICNKQEIKLNSIENTIKTIKPNSEEKAFIKSCEIWKRGDEFVGIYTKNGFKTEIIGEVKQIEINGQYGIELFARAWKDDIQIGFGKDGSVEIERFRIFNPPILVNDPNGTIIREWTDEITGELKQRKLREDPKEAVLQSLSHTISLVGKDGKNIVIGKIGNTTSTFYPDANPESTSADGMTGFSGTNQSWATVIGSAGNTSDDSATNHYAPFINHGTTSNTYDLYQIFIANFDTSAIPDTDNTDSATISFVAVSKSNTGGGTPNFTIAKGITASNTAVANGDYANTLAETTAYATEKSITSITADDATYTDFSINASGLSNISKTGVSKFSYRYYGTSVDNPAPMWASGGQDGIQNRTADQVGTTSDPKLVVVHSAVVATSIISDLILFE